MFLGKKTKISYLCDFSNKKKVKNTILKTKKMKDCQTEYLTFLFLSFFFYILNIGSINYKSFIFKYSKIIKIVKKNNKISNYTNHKY